MKITNVEWIASDECLITTEFYDSEDNEIKVLRGCIQIVEFKQPDTLTDEEIRNDDIIDKNMSAEQIQLDEPDESELNESKNK